MTKYTSITFTKLSEAIAYLEDGGELYDQVRDIPISISDTVALFNKGFPMYTKSKPTQWWYEKLDGTIEKVVLCWVDDFNSPGANSPTSQAAVVVSLDKNRIGSFVDNVENGHVYTKPLTSSEIQRFMDNAPG